ncbi:hypothetical protein K2173_018272 [Erythroxylum novogranatense]|uniref:GBF-interacting protein 1 N-terminal domain-containing protein n=1 Tax=Erythroxylum novogranatense TaxID=1862640 RepID=A0AAV8UA48_9ROSI|nr:hypothetical protein K2173_018272 [Erythroxylum novogranatense]
MRSTGAKLSIPSTTRKMIQNIKEITGNHSEEEIYAMLKECSMDPNETTQKLLLQDTFHEVKRKRDKRKENMGNRESVDSRGRTVAQGHGSKNLLVNFTPRSSMHDANGGKSCANGRDSGNNQDAVKGAVILLTASEEKNKETTLPASCTYIVANGSSTVISESLHAISATSLLSASGVTQQEVISSIIGVDKLGNTSSPLETDKTSSLGLGAAETCVESMTCSSNSLMFVIPASSSTVCFSPSDPVIVPTNDLRLPAAVGAIKCDVRSHLTIGESNTEISTEKSAPEIVTSSQGKIPSEPQGTGKSQLIDTSQPSVTSGHSGSFSGRPSSNYITRSQQIVGPQKAGPDKEWKPKPTSSNLPQGSGTVGSSDFHNNPVEEKGLSQILSSVLDSEESISKLQKKLEELPLPPRQHVIIPNHIHVPESERTKLSFGSFDATFTVIRSDMSAPQNEKSSTPISETSQVTEKNSEEQPTSSQGALVTTEDGAYPDNSRSPSQEPGNLCAEGDLSSNRVPGYNEFKLETAFISGGHQYSMVHTSPGYNFGFIPPMIGSQVAPFENLESQARDVSCLPSFVVQQPCDPVSYYAQFYRSGADNDGRVSPLPSTGIASKYNDNVTVLPPHTTQSPQEAGNSLVLSTAGPTPTLSTTQTAGLMQSSVTVTQQPVPVFRPPTGLQISHYPPSYISYGHFFSPYYVPPPSIHQFLSNGAFPQQPQTGGVHPAPPTASASRVKYSHPQYKSGTSTGNSNHIGVPTGYGPYGSSPAGYNPSSASTGGNSTNNEDLSASQFKESNLYMTGQQSEGSAVWIAAPGRDMSNLTASSFYSLPPQSQHLTFTPTQTGHGTFASMYHPAAAVHPLLQQTQAMAGAIDMVGPASSVYQQPQHQQINWPSNY